LQRGADAPHPIGARRSLVHVGAEAAEQERADLAVRGDVVLDSSKHERETPTIRQATRSE
jgi:hypothetical protein